LNRSIYLDFQATTPVDPRVLETMLPYLQERFGNAASKSHRFGFEADSAVKAAREQVADLLGASAQEIVFTSGSTEGINLALKGLFAALAESRDHFVSARTEHPAVIDTLEFLATQGAKLTWLDVDEFGAIDLERLRAAITPRTAAVALMAANNEIGTRHPLREIGAICRERDTLFFCDATQGVGKFELDVERDHIDLLSFSGHKLYAPKGVGALYVRRREPHVSLSPLFHGGGHEHGYRSGTLNVPGIVALGKACSLAAEEGSQEAARLTALRERLRGRLTSALDDVLLNGHPTARLPGNLSLAFRYVAAEALMTELPDVAFSAGSACHSASAMPSHVLTAIGRSPDLASSTLRIGLGRTTTEAEIDDVADRLVAAVKRLRDLSPLYEIAKAKRASGPAGRT
jgi:cysteine desulfurase